MHYSIDRPRATRIIISVRVPWAELSLLLPDAARVISQSTDIAGFRRGTAPYDAVEQAVGEFKILEAAAQRYIRGHAQEILEAALASESGGAPREPVGEPDIAVTKLASGDDLEFKVTLSLLPAVMLPDYAAIAKRVLAGRRTPEVSAADVQSALDWLRESRAATVTVHRQARLGDRVEVDFSARVGGVKLEGGDSKRHPLVLGQGHFVPGFEEALVGMRAGEEKVFTLEVPKNYSRKELAGKAVEFTARINLVQERTVPELNDAFARSLGDFSDVAALTSNVRAGIRTEQEAAERERLRIAIAQAVADEIEIEIPDALIDHELAKMVSELKRSVQGMGLEFSTYLGTLKKTEADLQGSWRPDALQRVKIALTLRAIARCEGLEPSAEEIQATAKRVTAHEGLTERDVQSFDRDAFLAYNRGIARNEKVFMFLESLPGASSDQGSSGSRA